MLYHGGAPMAAGGFLSIDVFFVLSGFLITSLLLGEWARSADHPPGPVLGPAGPPAAAGPAGDAGRGGHLRQGVRQPREFASLRLDSLSTLFYVANWHFIFGGGNYFDLTAQPSPLQHMWSLSIEEQFYIVWPPVVLVLLHLGRKLRPSRRLWPVLAAAVVGADRLGRRHAALLSRAARR